MFGNAPKTLWNRWVTCDDMNRITMASNCLLVQENGISVLIDSGISPYMDPKLQTRYAIDGANSRLIENLEAVNVSENDIDFVLLTHIHFDHISGLIPPWPAINDPDARPYFPNAKYLLNKRQYERALKPHPRDRGSYFNDVLQKLEQTERLIQLADSENIPELEPFISLYIADGHTPGMIMPLVKTDGETIFYPSDMISGTPWLHLPIVTGLERSAEALINDKKHYLERAVAEDWIVVFDHDAVTLSSCVRFNEEKGRYEAAID